MMAARAKSPSASMPSIGYPARGPPATPLAKKVEVLCQSQSITKGLQEVLRLLVDHTEEVAEFRTTVAGRLEVVESIARAPIADLEEARAAAMAELAALHHQSRELQSSLRAAQQAVFGEVELKHAELQAVVRRAQAEHERLRRETADLMAHDTDKFKRDLDEVTLSVATGTVARLRDAQTEMGEALRAEVDSIGERMRSAARDDARAWQAEAERAIRDAATFVREAAVDGIKEIDAAARTAVAAVQRGTETLSTLALQEAHHARCSSLLCEAQVTMLRDGGASALEAHGLRERLQRIETELGLGGAYGDISGDASWGAATSPGGTAAAARRNSAILSDSLPAAVLSTSPSAASLRRVASSVHGGSSFVVPAGALGSTSRRNNDELRASILGTGRPSSPAAQRRRASSTSPRRPEEQHAWLLGQQQQQRVVEAALHVAQAEVLRLREASTTMQRDVQSLGRVLESALVDKLVPLATVQQRLLWLLGVEEGWLLHRGAKASHRDRLEYLRGVLWGPLEKSLPASEQPRHVPNGAATPASSPPAPASAAAATSSLRDLAPAATLDAALAASSPSPPRSEPSLLPTSAAARQRTASLHAPATIAEPSAAASIGLEVAAPPSSRRRGRVTDVGVQVTKVWPVSRADSAGLRAGDLLLRVDQEDLVDVAQLETAIGSAKGRCCVVHLLRPSEARVHDVVLQC